MEPRRVRIKPEALGLHPSLLLRSLFLPKSAKEAEEVRNGLFSHSSYNASTSLVQDLIELAAAFSREHIPT